MIPKFCFLLPISSKPMCWFLCSYILPKIFFFSLNFTWSSVFIPNYKSLVFNPKLSKNCFSFHILLKKLHFMSFCPLSLTVYPTCLTECVGGITKFDMKHKEKHNLIWHGHKHYFLSFLTFSRQPNTIFQRFRTSCGKGHNLKYPSRIFNSSSLSYSVIKQYWGYGLSSVLAERQGWAISLSTRKSCYFLKT